MFHHNISVDRKSILKKFWQSFQKEEASSRRSVGRKLIEQSEVYNKQAFFNLS
jgi:hypothetical protein